MPTENRSSNTEQMVSVPREVAQQIATDTEHDNDLLWIAKEMRKILTQPAAQHQGEPVAWQYRVSAGAATGWSLWHEGKGEKFRDSYQVETRPLYTHAALSASAEPAPATDGFSAGDMANQGAKAFRDGQRALVLPDRELYTKHLPGVIPKNAAEVESYKDGWNACLEEVSRLNAAAIAPE